MENSKNTPTQEQLCQQVEQAWQSRVNAQGLNGLRGKSRKPSKLYREKQCEFFTGAMVVLEFYPPLWVYAIMRGDDILEERIKYPFSQVEGK